MSLDLDVITDIFAEPKYTARAKAIGVTIGKILDSKELQPGEIDREWEQPHVTYNIHLKYDVHDTIMTIPITQLPGCCGVDVIHQISLNTYGWPQPLVRHLGIGRFVMDVILEGYLRQARGKIDDSDNRNSPAFGPGILFAVTTVDQPAGAAICHGQRWRSVRKFRNPNTGNECQLWMKKLTERRYDKDENCYDPEEDADDG
jgi:hypothetical protein